MLPGYVYGPLLQRNIRGLTIAQESHKPGAAAALTATTQGTIKPRANHKSTVSGSTTSSNSSLSLPTDASGSESTLSSPSLPSSAFSSSAGSTSYSNRRSSSHQAYQNKLTEQLANLEIGVEFKLDLRAEDIEAVSELGHGNGGTVTKVRHIPTGAMMARKVGTQRPNKPMRYGIPPDVLVSRCVIDYCALNRSSILTRNNQSENRF